MERFTKHLRWLLASLMLVAGVGSVSAQTWEATAASSLATGDIVVIVDQTSGKAMSNNNGTSSAPSATAVTLSADKSELTGTVSDNVKWEVTVNSGSYQFKVPGTSNYVYCTASNNGVRVGTNANNAFTITTGGDNNCDFLVNTATSRYIGVYNSQDWRCYTTINNNIKGCVTTFYKYTEDAGDTRTATTVTFPQSSYVVNYGDAFTAPTATLDPAAAGSVTYASSNTAVATVNATTGAVTIEGVGTATITATFAETTDYKGSSASYTLTVAEVIPSLQALQEATTSTTAQDMTLRLTDVYVTGVTTNNAYISDGTYGALIYQSGHGLQAGQKLNGTITAKHQLYRGQTEITNFSSTGLTITNDALAPQVKTIDQISVANQSLLVTLENVTYDGSVLSDGTNTITPYTTFMSSLGLESGKTYNITGVVIVYNTTLEIAPRSADDIVEVGGTTDTREETTMYFAQDRTTIVNPGTEFTITVGETVPAIEGYVKIGDYEAYLPFTTALTYSGNNDALGNVDATTGAVTLVSGATGTLKVTATFDGDTERKGCEGYYTLKVKAATPTTGDLFNETFADFDSTGGRDDSYSGTVGNGSTTKTDEEGWTFEKCGGASSSLKFGTGSANGVFTTRSIALTGDGTLTFSAAGWSSGTNTLAVTATDGTLSGDTDVTLTNGEWTDYTVNITGATGDLVLTFTGKRGFIDDIKVVSATPDERTATTTSFNAPTESYEVTLGEAFTAPTATLDPAAAGSLIYESSDPAVATVNANTGAVEILAAGTTTITAKFEGNNEYKPSQASYTITVTAPATVFTTIQQLQEAATSTSTDFQMQMTDIYVTGVKGNQAWISDGTYGALIYTSGHGLSVGQKLNGSLSAKLLLYNGATEITNFNTSDLTITEDALATQTKTIGQIELANQSLPVKFEGVTYDATAKTFSDGTSTIAYYDQFSVSPTLEDGHVYNIAGLVIYYNKLQIAPLAATDVVDVTPAAAVEAPVFSVDGGTYTEDQTVEITCATTGASIYYTLDGTDPTTASTLYTEPVAITTTTTLKAIASDGTNTSTITEATYTINKPTPTTTEAFVLVEDGTITEGDYLIVYDGGAMNTTVEGNRLKFAEVSPDYNNIISTNNASIIWHIAKSGSYYTIYNAAANAYAAGTEVKNNAQMLADGTSDKALWTVEATAGETTFDFTNKANEAKGVNATLRRNGNFGFACYSTLTGDPLSLYKKVSTVSIDLIAAQDNYKTMVAPYDMVVPNISDGMEAYIVTLNSEQTEAYLERIVNIPAGTPIILHANSAGSYELEKAGTDFTADDVSENVLLVSNGEIEGDGTIFVLNKVNNVVGFYRLNDSMPLATGKCYLKIEKSTDVKFIGFNFDDATGIETVESTNDNLQGTIYNLAGQRVATPAHGLYIVNGKKVFIK